MSFEIYKVLHIIGLVLLMLGIGGILTAGPGQKAPRSSLILHGVGVLVVVGAGFGMMAKNPGGSMSSPEFWTAWLILKMVVWFFIAAFPALLKHGTVPRALGWLVVALLAGAAAYLGIVKPEFG